jgi:hypothetical protein
MTRYCYLLVNVVDQFLICFESAFDVFEYLVSVDADAFSHVVDEHSIGNEFDFAYGTDFYRYAAVVVNGGVLVQTMFDTEYVAIVALAKSQFVQWSIVDFYRVAAYLADITGRRAVTYESESKFHLVSSP